MRKYFNKLAIFLIAVPLMVGAYLAFPVYDDGYMMLFLREPGMPFSLSNQDRPIAGAIHGALVNIGGNHKIVYVLLNGFMWLLFAAEARALFRLIFPELRRYGTLAACLVLAPVVVETQVSAIVTGVTVNLFTMLSYATILLCLAHLQVRKRTEMVLLGGAFALAAFASFASEYAVATNLVGVILIAGLAFTESEKSRRRSLLNRSAVLLAVTVAAYLVFVKTADMNGRPDVNPTLVIGSPGTRLVAQVLNAISGVWYSVVAAYASILGGISLSWGSKSSLIGPILGLVLAGLLVFGARSRRMASAVERKRSVLGAAISPVATRFANRIERLQIREWKRAAVLMVAIAAGLAPVALMGRSTMVTEYDSRFRVPILPVAVALTVCLFVKVVPRTKAWIPIAVLGLVMGQATWATVYRNVSETRIADGLGPLLRPYAEKTGGITVAVVRLNRLQNELNAHITSGWPSGLEKRFWMFNEQTAEYRFGRRETCPANLAVNEKIRPIERFGPVSQLLWVELEPGKPVSIEPYCVAPVAYEPHTDLTGSRKSTATYDISASSDLAVTPAN